MPLDYDWSRGKVDPVPVGGYGSVLVDEPEDKTIPMLVEEYRYVHQPTPHGHLLVMRCLIMLESLPESES